MRFRIEQTFPGPLAAVEAAFCDAEFLRQVGALPKVGEVEVLDQRVEGGLVHQRVRYRFAGRLSGAVTAVVSPEKLTWVEESVLDRATHVTTWRIVPDNYADRLTCRGTFVLTSAGADKTRRVAEGELRVHFPLVGGRVERAIVSGLKEHASAEEEVMGSYLAREISDNP